MPSIAALKPVLMWARAAGAGKCQRWIPRAAGGIACHPQAPSASLLHRDVLTRGHRHAASAAPGGASEAPRSSGADSSASSGAPDASDAFAAEPGSGRSLFSRLVQWSHGKLGNYIYPAKADVCNCGIDMGILIPRPELVVRDNMEKGTPEWRMQLYGAAVYWHLATTPGANLKEVDETMLQGKDVLEVACMRGGGARYLAEVVEPRSYVATDNIREHLQLCQRLHPTRHNLRYEFADPLRLSDTYAADSFDAVIAVQANSRLGDLPGLLRSARQVLRPGGRIMIFDAVSRNSYKGILDTVADEELTIDVLDDLSRHVHAVGLCTIPSGMSYLRIVVKRPTEAQQQPSPHGHGEGGAPPAPEGGGAAGGSG